MVTNINAMSLSAVHMSGNSYLGTQPVGQLLRPAKKAELKGTHKGIRKGTRLQLGLSALTARVALHRQMAGSRSIS